MISKLFHCRPAQEAALTYAPVCYAAGPRKDRNADAMHPRFKLRQRPSMLCSLAFTWALCFFTCASSANGAETAKEASPFAQREYDLKVKEFQLKQTEHVLSLLGVGGTAFALVFGFFQYRKADQWKRAEFIAKEMKEFFENADVQNVLLMIDWAPRRINLFHEKENDPKKYPRITRDLQVSALEPHTLRVSDQGSDGQTDQESEGIGAVDRTSKFSMEETRIRDSYDRFLDHLERFASYLESGLVSKAELDPYLRYWIDDIAELTQNPTDAAWTCALLAYIQFYDFTKVQLLFAKYGHPIEVPGPVFDEQGKKVQDENLVTKLCEALRRKKESEGRKRT